jgi:hypothetical protein
MPGFHRRRNAATMASGASRVARRNKRSVEQAWPIVRLNSPRSTYVSGEALWTDGGFLGAMTMGRQKGFDLLEGGSL